MFPAVATKDTAAVQHEVECVYGEMFPTGDVTFVPRAFGWALSCFSGGFPGYQAVDTAYHDVEHTMQGTLCMARLLLGRHRAGAVPELTRQDFELALLAILLHDSGYLKEAEDADGTGAKYTLTHVARSADFAGRFLSDKGFSEQQIGHVQNMICCTGVNADPRTIPFERESIRTAGFALVTADLLGQMAADDYVTKLPTLYGEFREAASFTGDASSFIAGFSGPEDLMRRTPDFWRFVLGKLDSDFGGLYRYLAVPYPDGPNEYIQRVEGNIRRIAELCGASAKTNSSSA
jgi:hypothetical protein